MTNPITKSKMKRSLIILSVLFIITSCKAPLYTLGMSEKDFTTHKFLLQLVEATPQRTVYKRTLELDDHQREIASMYYYFEDGKLVRMQRVERQPDVIVEHTKG